MSDESVEQDGNITWNGAAAVDREPMDATVHEQLKCWVGVDIKVLFFFLLGWGGSDGRRIEYGYWFMVY